MNKHIRYGLILTSLAVGLAGCTSSEPKTDVTAKAPSEVQSVTTQTNTTQVEEEITDADKTEEAKADQSEVESFLSTYPTADQIGLYLKKQASDITDAEQKLMFEQLLLSQEELSNQLGQKIWEEDYMNALNVTLGGVLDAGKVSEIENEAVKKAFQSAVDGYLTIVRYEEYPNFEPDWKRLKELNLNLSDAMRTVINMNAKVHSGAFYDGYQLNHDLIASDIANIETDLPKAEGFDHYQLQEVYKRLVSMLFVSTEASELSMYLNDDARTVQGWNRIAEKYSDYAFGQLADKLVNAPEKDFIKLIELINAFNMVSPDKNVKVEITSEEYDGYSVNGFVLSGLENADAQALIHASIDNALMVLLDPQAKMNRMDASVSFINDNYLSVSLFNIAYDENNDYQSDEDHLTFDLKSGELVSLDDLFEAPFNTYENKLNQLDVFKERQIAVIEAPTYTIQNNSISLMGPVQENDFPYYISIDYYTLQKFMDVEKLY